MSKKILTVTLFAILGLFQVGMNKTGSERWIVKLSLDNYPAQMKIIRALDLDVAGIDYKKKQVDLVINPEQISLLREKGFNITDTRSIVSFAGPDTQYQSPEKIANLLKNYAAQYPTLAEVHNVGKSLEGRDIWAIKITKDVSKPDPTKPHILFNGMHHAREVMSVEVPLDTINTLLTQYGKDAKVTHWVDANEIWVLPMFNVDGNSKVWTRDNMWRKNTRGGYGVDINRNYPYAWNSCNGSSDYQGAQDYHGTAGGSEPETQVMMNLVKMVRPVFDISYHSYSEIVIYPYGCEGQHTPTREVVEGIGAQMAKLIKTDDGRDTYTPGTAPELLYSVDGGDIDWMYHEYQVIPYVIEVNSSGQGFQPSYTKWRDSTVARVRPAWQLLLDKLDGSSIHGQVQSQGQGIPNAHVLIERTSGGSAFKQDYPAHDTGYFDVILPPGQYKVAIKATGFQSQMQNVIVGNSRVEIPASLDKAN